MEQSLAGTYTILHMSGVFTWESPGIFIWQAPGQDWQCQKSAANTYECTVSGMPLGLSWVFDGGVACCGSPEQHASGQAFKWAKEVAANPTPNPAAPAPSVPNEPATYELPTYELHVLLGLTFKHATMEGHFNPGLNQTVDWVDDSGNHFKGFSLEGSHLSGPLGFFFDIKTGSDGNVVAVRCNDCVDWNAVLTVRPTASWRQLIPTPMVCSREGWKGVYSQAPAELISGFVNGNQYVHPGAALEPGLGSFEEVGKHPDEIPDSVESCGMKQLLEYINYMYMLGGRPCCRWGGITFPYMPADGKPRWHALHCSHNGVYAMSWGHFFGPSYTAAYEPGKVAHGQVFQGLGSWPQHLIAEIMPPKGERGQLIDDAGKGEQLDGGVPHLSAFFKVGVPAADDAQTAAQRQDCMPVFYGLPRTVMASSISPETCNQGLCQLDIGEPKQNFVPWSDARVYTWPPPGHTNHGWFSGECAGGHEGLGGFERMCAQASKVCGAPINNIKAGPVIKVTFCDPADYGKYTKLVKAELREVPGDVLKPCWVVDGKLTPSEYRDQAYTDMTTGCGGWISGCQQIALFPRGILTQNTQYRCDMVLEMSGEPDLEVSWTFQAFGPRVYIVKADGKPQESINWALECISFASGDLKPCMRQGKPVPHHIKLGPGEHVVKVRGVVPGAWLIIEGHPDGSTLVFQTSPQPEMFRPLAKHAEYVGAALGDDGQGYEWEWDMPDKNVFDMTQNAFLLSQHDEGEGTPIHIQPESVATLIGVTLKHNGTVGLAAAHSNGRIELVDCVNLGPELNSPNIHHFSER